MPLPATPPDILARAGALSWAREFFYLETDLEGRITYASPAFIEHYRLGPAVIGTNALLTIVPDDQQRCLAAVEQLLAHPEAPVSLRLRKPHSDGGVVVSHWEFSALRNADGAVCGIACIGFDVSPLLADGGGDDVQLARTQQAYQRFREELLGIYAELISSPPTETIYQHILEAACRVLTHAEQGSIVRLGDDGRYHYVAARGFELDKLKQISLPPEGVLPPHGGTQPRCYRGAELQAGIANLEPPVREQLLRYGRDFSRGSVLAVPVVQRGVRQAILFLDSAEEDSFDALDLALAEAFASQIGIVIERLALEAQLNFLALHDPLTGLPNRASLEAHLSEALCQGRPTALLYIDLDDFKLVNDLHGHPEGDKALKELAQRMQRAAPEGLLARYGGDEFVLLLEGEAAAQAPAVAKRLLRALGKPSDELPKLAASIGIAYGEAGIDAASLIQRADIALYQAKRDEHHRIHTFDVATQAALLAEEALLRDFDAALEYAPHQFTLYYQPIVALTGGAVVSYEALVRWQHPKRGLLTPGAFLPLAARRGRMGRLGSLVLRKACEFASRRGVTVSVNLAAAQLTSALVGEVRRCLEANGLKPSQLWLELSEEIVLHQERLPLLRQLAGLGVALLLDDFGSGYAQLEYLGQLPLYAIKLGQQLLAQTGKAPAASPAGRIIAAIASLAQALEVTVIAEGIERPAQRDHCRQLGIALAQGYLFAPPQPERRLFAES